MYQVLTILFVFFVQVVKLNCLPKKTNLFANQFKPVVLDQYDWDAGIIENEIVRILLEDHLGYKVEYSPISTDVYNWDLLSSEAYTLLWVWVTTDNRKQKLAKGISDRTIEVAGPLGYISQAGIYIPEKTVREYPGLASYHGLVDPALVAPISLTNTQIAQIRTPLSSAPVANWVPTNGKGFVIVVLPSYGGDPIPSFASRMGLYVERQSAGSETRQFEVLQDLIAINSSAIISLWTPHPNLVKWKYLNNTDLKLERVALPVYNKDYCNPEGATQNCDFNTVVIQKLIWAGLNDYNKELYWLFRAFSLTLDDINNLMAEKVFGGKEAYDVAFGFGLELAQIVAVALEVAFSAPVNAMMGLRAPTARKLYLLTIFHMILLPQKS
ncbi:hypothetical protein O9G_001135 [Rozella allomycis CSF55]|uniref:ABC-type glycine betaine transport system substrate-binding domain-containing protein n=1 Tax=Rozella allomycis (strain CSF55) TaxID=988480 RepID=A0A075ASB6_ROZAC|nr:hypothetical protein O9G_001135 [Rozella allomycis CSF55]|eukprot:EPZ33166.1 hypothetical protein O9G_001135 [Rozella allomycis CSF55]